MKAYNIYFVNPKLKNTFKIGELKVKEYDTRRSLSMVLFDALWFNPKMKDFMSAIGIISNRDREIYLDDLCDEATRKMGEYIWLSDEMQMVILPKE